MKRLLTCLFLILGLGLAFSVNTNASDKSLKSAMKIDKKEKVKYSTYNDGAGSIYWNFMYPKMNDLRGDGNVFYVFDSYFDKYYRINEDDKVVSSGKMNFKEQSNLYLRLKRLLDTRLMGDLFKVIFTYKSKKDNFLGFK